ncbi:MAG: hypothetical protein HOO96_34445 [Polyangiaceae bacterium]|nr:hypothetical protein [Polyangiaceae bacterium]
MPFEFRIESLTFSGGQVVEVQRDQILVLIGPNNAGKSRALRDIKSHSYSTSPTPVVSHVSKQSSGAGPELAAWRDEHLHAVAHEDAVEYGGVAGRVWERIDLDRWPSIITEAMSNQVCLLSGAEERFQLVKPAESRNTLTQRAEHPVHLLQREPELLERVNACIRKAFDGLELIVNWGGGQLVPLHCGVPPQSINPVSPEYLQQLRLVPRLDAQGDGIKSFVGCLLHMLLGPWLLVMLDEPEVFLHPPQAFVLGTMIADQCPVGRQLILATHSADLVRGLLERASDRLKIVRLERHNDQTHAHELSYRLLSDVAKDPLLRFSNILDGVFHERVVLCESDSDCRFYSAVLYASGQGADTMFVHCGGKDRMPNVVSTMRGLGASISVIADFDVLNSDHPLKDLVRALGGDWLELEHLWRVVKDSVERDVAVPTRDNVREELRQIVEKGNGKDPLTDLEAERVKAAVKFTSPWKVVKRSGIQGISSGSASAAATALISELKALGLHVVPCGEVERFVPSVGGHGPRWVNAVLDGSDLAHDSRFDAAREFLVDTVGGRSLRNHKEDLRPARAKVVRSTIGPLELQQRRPLSTGTLGSWLASVWRWLRAQIG